MKSATAVNRRRKVVRSTRLLLAACLSIAIPTELAMGVGIILDTGFDNFSNGALQLQSGWLTAGMGPAIGSGASTATVQTSTFLSPNKGVTVVRAAAADGNRRWAKPVTDFPTQRFVTVDWDMRVSQPTTLTAFGPFFGVDTYDADVAPHRLGTLGVDATTGDVLYQLQDSGDLQLSGSTVDFDVWNHFRIVLDFATDSYKGYVNGSFVASTGFVDREENLDDFTDADIATFAVQDDPASQLKSGSAVFDNFVIRDGLMGDYDIEGNVNEHDYTDWRTTFGSTVSAPGSFADGSNNGIVDAADYVLWRKHVGQSLFSGTGAFGGPVPEPTSALSFLASAAFFPQASRRRLVNRRVQR